MEPFNFDELESKPSDFSADIDPRLQFAATMAGSGITRSGEIKYTEVNVSAIVKDFASWEATEDVKNPLEIGATEDGSGIIVTGRIPLQKVKEILALDHVLDIEHPRPVEPLLQHAVPETEATPAHFVPGNQTNGGRGVLVGVVDYGCDIGHANFRNADGTTRIEELWDQDGPMGSSGSSPNGYGASYSSAQINHALTTANPYMALNYDLFRGGGDPSTGTHGTHVMDIAAGNGQGRGIPGFAPQADLMFVNLSHQKEDFGPETVGKSLGDSTRLLESVKYIFDRAGDRPAVVNLSIGGQAGPHDGSTIVEQGIDALVRAAPNRAVVIAAGNSRKAKCHAKGTIQSGDAHHLQWGFKRPLQRPEEIEIWYPGDSRVRVELFGPEREPIFSLEPSENIVKTLGYNVAIYASNTLNNHRNGDNSIGIYFAPGAIPPGVYTLRMTLLTEDSIVYRAWLERNNTSQSEFGPQVDQSMTLGSVSCGRLSLVVGAYDAADPNCEIGSFSSEGPTRDRREKPELSAPGVQVSAACSGTGTDSIAQSGTSMAAPAVAGIIALVYAEARARGRDLTIQELRSLLFKAARRNPPEGNDWHPQYGYGRLSAKAALEELAKLG